MLFEKPGAKMIIHSNHSSFRRILSLVAIATTIALTQADVINAKQAMGDIDWLSNVEQAKNIAQKQNKLVLLHFDASWSRPSKALETYVFKSTAVKKAIVENVVPVRLDADRALDMVNEYDVSMVPFDVIITPNGRVVSERRSPADAENYSKMISNTSRTSRLLEKEEIGPIAHQREVIQNKLISVQDPLGFRAKGPSHQFGLSKDSSLLQRRQTAFNETAGGNSQKQTNPFMNSASENLDAGLETQNEFEQIAVEDLERNQFLNRERNWVAPSPQTRPAAPKRIINDRYFESIAEKKLESKTPFTLASSSKTVTLEPSTKPQKLELPAADGSYDLTLDSNLPSASLSQASGELSDSGDFKVTPTSRETALNSVIEITEHDESPNDLTSSAPAIDRQKLCLKGKCPVTLITEGRWEDGDTRYGIVHRNRTYIFASAEKLNQFRANPDNYSPILAGYDPVIYHEQGKLVEGLVENGVFMGSMPNQKVILFKDSQTRGKFQASPKEYLESIRQATNNDTKGTMMR